MTDRQAEAKAKKLYGKRFCIRNSGHMTSPERRGEARNIVITARAEINRIDEEIKRRLAECDWYQELMKAKQEQRDQMKKVEGHAHHYRFDVGTSDGMFFHVKGQGDTWEEAFAMAEGKGGKAA